MGPRPGSDVNARRDTGCPSPNAWCPNTLHARHGPRLPTPIPRSYTFTAFRPIGGQPTPRRGRPPLCSGAGGRGWFSGEVDHTGWGGRHLAVPRAQVADSDSDDLRRPVWTQGRIVPQELVRHLLLTEASVHQTTHILALVQRHRVTPGVPEAGRSDICPERARTAVRNRLRSRPLKASRWRIGVRVRDGRQSGDRQDSGAKYPDNSRRANDVGTTPKGRPDDASTNCHIRSPLARNDVVNFRPVILRPAQKGRRSLTQSLAFRTVRRRKPFYITLWMDGRPPRGRGVHPHVAHSLLKMTNRLTWIER